MSELFNEIDVLKSFDYANVIEEQGFKKVLIRFHQNVESMDNEDDKERLFNLHNVVLDDNGSVVCRGLPFFAKYDKLSRTQQIDFLSDKMTMIEFIQGDRVNVTFINNKMFISSNSDEAREKLIQKNIEPVLKKIYRVASGKNDKSHSICLKISKDNQVYIEGIVSNSDEPEFFEEKAIDMMVNNFCLNDNILRPMHYTTSLNESSHKPNTEWIARNGNVYCLMLNKLKKEKN